VDPLELVQQSLYSVAQQLARACLNLDPGTRYRLEALDGKVAGLQISDLGMRVYLCPSQQGIELSADSRVAADVFASGRAQDLFALLQSNSLTEAITIDGDEALFMELLSITQNLELDWEAAIAPLTGDVLAHQIGKNFRASEKWLAASLVEAKRLAEEYMQEEFPVARESEQFKPLFDKVEQGIGSLKAVGDSLRDKFKGP